MRLHKCQIQIAMTVDASGRIKTGQILHVTVCAGEREVGRGQFMTSQGIAKHIVWKRYSLDARQLARASLVLSMTVCTLSIGIPRQDGSVQGRGVSQLGPH